MPSKHSSEMFFPFSFFPNSSTEVGIEVYLQSKTLGKRDFIFKVKFTDSLHTVKFPSCNCMALLTHIHSPVLTPLNLGISITPKVLMCSFAVSSFSLFSQATTDLFPVPVVLQFTNYHIKMVSFLTQLLESGFANSM